MATRGYYYDGIDPKDYITDKDLAMRSFIMYQLDRTQSMFTYKNLPDTMPEHQIELMLQKNGNIFVAKHEGELYAFTGGLGGEPDVYYRPTLYTVSNPALNLSKSYTINEDGVLVKNDTMMWGLVPLLSKYGALLVENEISLRTIVIYLRIVALISAGDDKTKASADKFVQDIVAGKLSVVGESPFFDGVKIQSLGQSNTSYIQQFVELEQYLKGSLFNELGLNANYNMKRETLTKNETTLNEDFLMPFCDDMLAQRKEGWDRVNEMFGTDISVEFSSTWKKRYLLDAIELRNAINEGQTPTPQPGDPSSQLDEELDSTTADGVSADSDVSTIASDGVEEIVDETVTDSADDGIDSTSGTTEESDDASDESENEEQVRATEDMDGEESDTSDSDESSRQDDDKEEDE